ncbi:MAG: SEC59/DGK1/VTE5 family protein [Nanoarchaeota archaeon]|nr:SEC59/DGK1/VTE5 family protein [Nanoarchaeota archaeon]MBU1644575.1 SEC59/DGK1/VTE5 family protein [Nanoarchaeota archaeon]MBU1977035.1 SEC59/DGK1/VTE5 family protein [Nanoarchaeota archaeon]
MLTKKELRRQIFHTLLGVIVILLISIGILSPLSIFLIILVGMMISMISKRIKIPFVSFFLKHFEREEAMKKFPGKGVIFFFVGVLLSLQLFEKDIALASIMVLSLGDSVSHLIGKSFGRIKNIFNGDGKKLLEGTLAGTLAGFFGALVFVPFPEAFLGAFGAMIVEVVKIDFNDLTLDDNLVVPLVAGTIMFLLRTYL